MLDVAVKCRSLLLWRMWLQSQKEETATATWLEAWGLVRQQENPQHVARLPTQLAYLRRHAQDMACIVPPDRAERPKNHKRRLYDTLLQLAAAGKTPPMMRIVQKKPTINWDFVRRNLHATCASDEVRSAWYFVIHDILPTPERLPAINLVDTDVCRQCGRPDTLTHRLTACGDGPAIWDWTRRRVAMMLSMEPRHIPIAWTLYPDFRFWPPGRRRAVLWILAHMVWFRTKGPRCQSLVDYIDHMRRSKCRAYAQPKRLAQVGKCLDMLYTALQVLPPYNRL